MPALADIHIEKVKQSRIKEVNFDQLGFGREFSDHMLEMQYENESWSDPHIKPYGPIEITPSLNTLHYGQSVFEGTKAYYVNDNQVNLFRPEKNFERMQQSCERLCIPSVSRSSFLEGIKTLVKLDHRWVPQKDGASLYIRPFACAWDPRIAARVSDTYRFFIITSPVGAYYNDPVKLITSKKYVRAAQGGTGEAKTAGNYAGSLYPAQKAHDMGYDQVLWLDALEHKYVEEVGTMNIFFLIDDVLITAPLGGTILPGVTRDSVLTLAKHWGMEVEERRLSINEIMDAGREGALQEVFGAGTAAVISPVEAIRHDDEVVEVDQDGRGPIGQKLYDTIYGMQTGRVEDTFGWVKPVEVG